MAEVGREKQSQKGIKKDGKAGRQQAGDARRVRKIGGQPERQLVTETWKKEGRKKRRREGGREGRRESFNTHARLL